MNKCLLIAVLSVFLLITILPASALAHGVEISYSSHLKIEITATYDSGEPMGEAEVVVYAPNDPATPWLKGQCNDEGHFEFSPDPSLPGMWDVQVIKGGHGAMLHIPIEEGSVPKGSSGGYSTTQIVVMALSIGWGLIATALYFRRRRA